MRRSLRSSLSTGPRPSSRRAPARASLAALAALTLPLGACSAVSDVLGGSAPDPVAEVEALQGGDTRIALDRGFTRALGDLGLTPGTSGSARLTRGGSLVLPITGGNVTVFEPGEVSPYVVGQVQHESSGLTLAAGGTTVRLSALNVDPGVSRVYGDVAVNGRPVASSAYLFRLDGRSLEPLEADRRTAVLTGTRVTVSPVAARLLNQTFDTRAVKGGLLVGVATITVATGGGRG